MKEKKCSICGEVLPIKFFSKDRSRCDGHTHRCKPCDRVRVINYKNNRGGREKQREYEKTARGREARKKAVDTWAKKSGYKMRAHWRVKSAIKAGLLKRLPCEVCGNEKSQAHHEDYSKPLDVVFLCDKHHKLRHRKDYE